MATENDENYSSYYRTKSIPKVYPTEFVIRSFLGKYPRLAVPREELANKKILDLGFGDGRNMGFLNDLGMQVHGVEVTDTICQHIMQHMKAQGIQVEAKAGRNAQIPYADGYFDHILACNSCYYIDEGQRYSDNLAEIARVIKPNGLFVHSLPMATTFIMDNAIDEGDGHMRITQDPYGVRVGAMLKKFDSEPEIIAALDPWFTDIQIGSCRDDYWGSLVHLWFVVCRRRA